MSFESCYEMASPDVVAEGFNDEIVILNLAKGKYYSLTGLAFGLWNYIVEGKQPRELLEYLATAEYEHTDNVKSFINALIAEELVRPLVQSGSHSANSADIELSLSSETDPPTLVAFDDMAELILADPIHDTEEEAGWPVKRALD
jgi:hypothetical protein